MKKRDSDRVNFFPLHLDSGNRGCEAIARGTCEILKIDKNHYVALSRTVENDCMIGLNKSVSYFQTRANIISKIIIKLFQIFPFDQKIKNYIKYHFQYSSFLNSMSKSDVCFVTGGDMMCYENNQVNYIVHKCQKNKKRVILWGCSFGEENVTKEKRKIISEFSLITARESLTYAFLTEKLGLKNVFLFPDPAFVLKPEPFELPYYFDGSDCIGLNLSNFVGANVDKDSLFGRNIVNLISYILNKTDFKIVFVPHVIWPEQDDRSVANYYKELFGDNDRIFTLDIHNLNYCQIRYAISKCRFFIGARTHAMISAYSVCVPSIALGYSIKSKGIAKDLNLPDYSVVDYRSLKSDHEIVDRLKKLLNEEQQLKFLLKREMPSYIKKAYSASSCFTDFLNKVKKND